MSIVFGQKAILGILQTDMKRLRMDVNFRKCFLDNYTEYSATFMQFVDEAAAAGIVLENFVEPRAEVEEWIMNTELTFSLGFPRDHKYIPAIGITLGEDTEEEGYLGGVAHESRDDSEPDEDTYYTHWGTDKARTYQVHLIDENPNAVEILHQIVDFILVSRRVLLEQMGLKLCRFSAGDIRPQPEMLEAGQFVFERVVSVNCRVIMSYKYRFFDVSPIPNTVFMASDDPNTGGGSRGRQIHDHNKVPVELGKEEEE